MKIKPGICSIFCRPYTLKILLRYLSEIETQSQRRFPLEFDTGQEEEEDEDQPPSPNVCFELDHSVKDLNQECHYQDKTMLNDSIRKKQMKDFRKSGIRKTTGTLK